MPARLCAALLVLLAQAAWAAQAPASSTGGRAAKELWAARVTTAPLIDGQLDEELWRSAQAERTLTQNYPMPGASPSEPTEVAIVYDERALYVGVRCHDREADRIVPWLTRRDRETNADKFSIDIDSKNDHLSAYHFEVNVSGVLVDGLRYGDTDYTTDWDGLWTARTARSAYGWTAEIEIPWRTLRFAPGTTTMGLQFRRFIARQQETDEWIYIPRAERGEVSRYGHLRLDQPLSGSSRLFQLLPYAATRLTLAANSGDASGIEIAPNAGLDLKLGLTSSLTLDATFNPDFGQVEADQAQLNLTTFELFYPEKRPFFLEGADIFALPLLQFYTRRIGRAPPGPIIGDDETLRAAPNVGRIWGAVKVSGRLTKNLAISLLDAVTARQDAVVERADGTLDRHRLSDPLANYSVLRLRAGFGSSYFGVTGTAVNRFETAADRTICGPSLRCTHDAYTLGVDGRLQSRSGRWRGELQALVSHISQGPPRSVADGTVLQSGDTGVGIETSLTKAGGHVLFRIGYRGLSTKLDLADAGYLRRSNLHDFNGVLTLRKPQPFGPFLDASWELFGGEQLSWTGRHLSSYFGNWASVRFRSFWQLSSGFGYNFKIFDNRETRDGAITERLDYFWWSGYLRSDPRRSVVWTTYLETGVKRGAASYVAGPAPYVDASVELAFHPLPQLEFQLRPAFSFGTREPRWYDTDLLDDGTRRYLFGALRTLSADLTIRGTYTFTPRLTLQAYFQLFSSSGTYSNYRSLSSGIAGSEHPLLLQRAFEPRQCAYFEPMRQGCDPAVTPDFRYGAINSTVVLRWEYRTGSTLIVVYSHAQSQRPYQPLVDGAARLGLGFFRGAASSDTILLKLSYLWG